MGQKFLAVGGFAPDPTGGAYDALPDLLASRIFATRFARSTRFARCTRFMRIYLFRSAWNIPFPPKLGGL